MIVKIEDGKVWIDDTHIVKDSEGKPTGYGVHCAGRIADVKANWPMFAAELETYESQQS